MKVFWAFHKYAYIYIYIEDNEMQLKAPKSYVVCMYVVGYIHCNSTVMHNFRQNSSHV